MKLKKKKMRLITNRNAILLILLLMFGIKMNAQITITNADMPSPEDIINTSTGLNIDFINYEETGENHIWDFSQLIPVTQTADTFISILDVPIFVALYFGDKSNLVKKDNTTIPIPDLPITKQYSFFNNTSASYNNAGVLYTISGLPIPLKYNSSDVIYKFPLEYGNAGSSFADYEFGVDDFGYIKKEINRSNIVDGWGTLTTPYGTFDVLRLKSEVVEFDSIYVDSLGIGLPLYREYTEYSWLANNQKIPLLKITSSFGGAIVTYVDSLRFPSAINNNIAVNDVMVFPNPTTHFVNISLDLFSASDVLVEIIDSNGNNVANKSVKNQKSGKIDFKMDLQQIGLKSGVYFLKITLNNQYIVKRVVLL